jgi:hypothetical protein
MVRLPPRFDYQVKVLREPRTDSLSNALKNEGEKPRWTAQDAYILIHKCAPFSWLPPYLLILLHRVDSLDVRHDSEIDWKTFPDPDWNLWSPHLIQRRWTTMKRGVKGHETMSHAGSSCVAAICESHELTSHAPTTRNFGCFEGEEGTLFPHVFRPFSQEKVQER